MSKQEQGPTLWLGKFPILKPEDANMLEQQAAINEFHMKMPREAAEAAAHGRYAKDLHQDAAAHHLTGMEMAHTGGYTNEALEHYGHFKAHMNQLGLDHMTRVPHEIRTRLQNGKGKKLYRFKEHEADRLVIPMRDSGVVAKSERLAEIHKLASKVVDLGNMKKLLNTESRLQSLYKAATEALEMKKVAPPGFSEATMHKLKVKYGEEGAFKVAWAAHKKSKNKDDAK